jgi:hypothetical protein
MPVDRRRGGNNLQLLKERPSRIRLAGLPGLRLGRAWPLTTYGVRQVLRRRGTQAGLP